MIVQWFGPFCDVLSIWQVTSGGIPVSVTVWDMGNQFLWFEPVYEVVLVLFVLFCVILRCFEYIYKKKNVPSWAVGEPSCTDFVLC